MKRLMSVRRSVSWFLVFILSFQSLFFAVPASAWAISWPDGFLWGSTEITSTPAPARPERLVARTTETPALVDYSGGLLKGAGFKFQHQSGDFADFRLEGELGAEALTLGKTAIFNLPGKTITYKAGDTEVKEEIVYERRPPADRVAFNFKSSDLAPEKKPDGGYFLHSPTGANVFEVLPPVAYDAKGRRIGAELQINKNRAVIELSPADLDKAVYPIVVDPTIVALSAAGPGLASQRNTFFDGSRYWVFYADWSNLKSKSSTDGYNWTQANDIAPGAIGEYLSTHYAGNNTVYVAYVSGYSIMAKKRDNNRRLQHNLERRLDRLFRQRLV